MKETTIALMLAFATFFSCKPSTQEKTLDTIEKSRFVEVAKEDYELYKPNEKAEAVLILFGGYPERAEDIKREFEIIDIAIENNIAVILSNFNQKLWLEEHEKYQLAKELQNIIEENQLPSENVFIGGFSSGGLVSLLISNFMAGVKESHIIPKGVFVIDSPIDLEALYKSSEKNIERAISEASVQESIWLLETLNSNFGNPTQHINKYEDKSVFIYSTNNTSNLMSLKNTKIRLYTEPDTLWWKKNRGADYDQTNAFYIKKLSKSLIEKGFKKVEYIATANKGYRANGERHPHSWSIVNKTGLINWILSK